MGERTTFAGLLMLEPGEPLETEGNAFIQSNIRNIDRLLEVGAVTHRHDASEPIDGPSAAPGIATVASGGSIPADVTMYAGYTLVDGDSGETLMSPIATSGTRAPANAPDDAPSAVIDYTGGALRADTYYYVLTFLDGEGGETPAGPWAQVEREPGFASGQVQLSGMGVIADAADMPAWAVYRAAGGQQFHYIASGAVADNTLTDDGTVCADCTRYPPSDFDNRTNRTNSLILTVPDSTELQAASAFRVYMTVDNNFFSPALLGEYPIASAGSALTYRSLDVEEGAPPDVPTTVRGASLIDPDTELLDWHWKRPVATVGDLPTDADTHEGDVRIVLDGNIPYIATADGGPWEPWADADVAIGQVAASGSGSVAPASAIMFRGSGGITASAVASGGSAVVTLGGGDAALAAMLLESGKGVVAHGASANVARPSGYKSIEWIGSVEPTNATADDTWIDTT